MRGGTVAAAEMCLIVNLNITASKLSHIVRQSVVLIASGGTGLSQGVTRSPDKNAQNRLL